MSNQKITVDQILRKATDLYPTIGKSEKKALENIFGEEVFKPKHPNLIKTYEEACAVKGIVPLTFDQFSFLPDDQQEYYFFHHQIVTIVDVLNNGRVPNYNDASEAKYELWFDMRSEAAGGSGFSYYVYDSDDSFSGVGARLVFFDLKIARYAAQQFLAKYKVIMTKIA